MSATNLAMPPIRTQWRRDVRCSPLAVAVALLIAASGCAQREKPAQNASPARPSLKVCADPNNLPFSNARGEGFENRIATLVAHDLGRRLQYVWWPQRRGFVRMTLKAGACDVVMGVPENYELASPTEPYYRSSYVFVSRKERHLHLESLDDPALHRLRIGVQLAGDEGSPPVLALAKRKLIDNMRGFTVYGDYFRPEPSREIVDAVARGDVDVAIVWGPQAGWFARQEKVALDLEPVMPQIDPPFLPFVFDIAMGVRRGDAATRDALNSEIERRSADIERILDAYGVPRV